VKILKQNATLGIRLEYDEGAAQKYRLLSGDEVVLSTNVESLALLEYDDLFTELDAPFAARRRRETDFKFGQQLQNERVARTSSKAAKTTGGKGGRGGV